MPEEQPKVIYKDSASRSVQQEKIKFGLKIKLSVFVILLIILVVSIIASVLTMTITKREEKQSAQQMVRNMNLSIEYLSSTASDAIVSFDDLLLVNTIEKVSGFEDVEYIIVTDKKNYVLGHSKGVDQIGRKLTDKLSITALKSDKVIIQPEFKHNDLAPSYEISSPIMFRDKKVGVARIAYSTASIFHNLLIVKRNIILTSILVIIGTLALGVLGSIFLASITTKPVKALVDGLRAFGSGDLNFRIKIRSRDELGYLADEFNKMAKEMKEYQKLQVEREVEKNLFAMAKKIQSSLVPQEDLVLKSINVAKYFRTVFGVGGDYYDYFEIGKDHLGVLVSDVFGKGMPASLVMVTIRALLHTYKGGILNSTAELVDIINKRIWMDFKGEQYATLFFIIIERKTGKLIFTNAGHLPLLVYRKSAGTYMIKENGELPIGMMGDTVYKNYAFKLEKGDLIILNTDGITEAENDKQEQFGDKRLKELIKQNSTSSADKIVSNVIKQVRKFMGDAAQHDDMTFIIIEYKGG
ncbi:MAG: SpoIIE family protein phosphatase [Spirochaetes bacterium]|nr:SpoIIE family protein phosphatase [Spirochaetota bacterium]